MPIKLLLVSCSATKRHDKDPIAAIERYQGPVFHVIRNNRPGDLVVWILSAKFGLISETTDIPDYDQKMSVAHVLELTNELSQRLDDILRSGPFTGIFLNMGKMYTRALTTSMMLPPLRDQGLVTEAHGGIGLRLQQTKQWLLALAQ